MRNADRTEGTAQKQVVKKGAWEAALKLYPKFQEYRQTASGNLWFAAEIAEEMRSHFPAKSKKGDKGWTDFCKDVLKRDDATVNEYVRAMRYCKEHCPHWKANVQACKYLPPISLVALVSSIEPSRRSELHTQLFEGNYGSADEFRDQLRDFQRSTAKANGKENKHSVGAASVDGDVSKKVQRLNPDDLPALFKGEKHVNFFSVLNWSDATDLIDKVSDLILKDANTFAKGGLIQVPAIKGGK